MPTLPVPGVTDGPDWAVMVNAAINEVETRGTPYTRVPTGSFAFWASPAIGVANNTPLNLLINQPLWFPPMGAAVQGFVNINTTTAGLTGDTVTVTMNGCTPTYDVDTGVVLATVVFPIGTTLGRVEVAMPAGFVIPSPMGMWAQITAYTGGSPARPSYGSPQGISPGRSWSITGSNNAVNFGPAIVPNIFFRRTA